MKRDVQSSILQAAARFIRKQLEPVLARLSGIEEKALTIEKLMDSARVREMIDGLVEKRVAEVVKALPTPSIPEPVSATQIRAMVDESVAALPAPAAGKDADPADIARMVAEAVAALPKPENGKDAEPINLRDVVAELLETGEVKTVCALHAAEAVAEHLKANPLQHGKDAEPVSEAAIAAAVSAHLKAHPIPDPLPGKDGVGLAGAMIDRDGALILTLTNGETRNLGRVEGKDGDKGRDGLSVTDLTREYDADAHEIVERWTSGGVTKELRYPAGGIRPGGYWRDGGKALSGEAWTHDGSLWIAKRDTTVKPSHENKDDWTLAARKGRDGEPGRPGKDYVPPEPVPLVGYQPRPGGNDSSRPPGAE